MHLQECTLFSLTITVNCIWTWCVVEDVRTMYSARATAWGVGTHAAGQGTAVQLPLGLSPNGMAEWFSCSDTVPVACRRQVFRIGSLMSIPIIMMMMLSYISVAAKLRRFHCP